MMSSDGGPLTPAPVPKERRGVVGVLLQKWRSAEVRDEGKVRGKTRGAGGVGGGW